MICLRCPMASYVLVYCCLHRFAYGVPMVVRLVAYCVPAVFPWIPVVCLRLPMIVLRLPMASDWLS